MAESPATTAPEINTDVARGIATMPNADYVVWSEVINHLADAVDTLRKQFAAQQTYINGMERRWIAAPHGGDCNMTTNTPCDCWKAS